MKMIAALQVSLDGFARGPEGEADWVDSWSDAIGLIPDVEAYVLGAGMYPGYGEYWAALEANPRAMPYESRAPYEREVEYVRAAAKKAHYVLSRKLDRVSWPPTATIVRDVKELRSLRAQPGKNAYVVGGPTVVATLLDEELLDEVRLIVHPILLGGGTALFAGLKGRRSLQLSAVEPTTNGRVILTYRC